MFIHGQGPNFTLLPLNTLLFQNHFIRSLLFCASCSLSVTTVVFRPVLVIVITIARCFLSNIHQETQKKRKAYYQQDLKINIMPKQQGVGGGSGVHRERERIHIHKPRPEVLLLLGFRVRAQGFVGSLFLVEFKGWKEILKIKQTQGLQWSLMEPNQGLQKKPEGRGLVFSQSQGQQCVYQRELSLKCKMDASAI